MELGASRDWDLFSFIAIPVTLFSILIISKLYKERLRNAGIIIIGCCFLHTLPWILVNSSKNHSLERFEKLANSKTWSNFAKPLAFDELRMHYMQEKDFENALEWALKAYSINQNRRFAINIASVYLEMGRQSFEQNLYSDAEHLFRQAYRYYPDNFDINQSLGVIYTILEDHEKAINHYLQAIKIRPDDITILRDLSVLYVLTKKYDKAEFYLDEAIDNNTNEELHERLLKLKKEIEQQKK